MHVVASKCSRSRFLSDKYKTVQSFRPHFLQNSPRVQLHTSAGDCKVVGNISGSQCESLFKSSIAFLIMLVTSQSSVASMPISVEGTRKNRLQPGQESIVHAPVLSYCSLLRKPQPKPTGVQEHCREGETNSFFPPFFGAFPSDRIPKLMNDVNVHFLFTEVPVNYTSDLMERFEATTYMVSVSFHLFMTYGMPQTSVH